MQLPLKITGNLPTMGGRGTTVIENRPMNQYKRIGEILLERGLIQQSDLDDVLSVQSKFNRKFGEILRVIGLVSEWDVTQCLSEQFKLPIISFDRLVPDPAAVALIPREFAMTRQVLPLKINDREISFVISDPLSIHVDELKPFVGERRVAFALAQHSHLMVALELSYLFRPESKKSKRAKKAA